nr:LysR substrate-binding domain-containing protein [Halomonas sp.]
MVIGCRFFPPHAGTQGERGTEGLGLIRAASYMVRPHLKSGQLQRVLGEIQAPVVPISIMYPHNRHLSPTVRAFVDWAIERIQLAETQWQVSHID